MESGKFLEEHDDVVYCCQSASKSLINLFLYLRISLYPNHPNDLATISFKSIKKKAPQY